MCDALEVSESGYHAWLDRASSRAEHRRGELVAAIEVIHAEVRGRYGSPRVTAELNARGHEWSESTVAKLMRDRGIRAKTVRRFVRTTDSRHGRPAADNVLGREFAPAEPNAAWSADITYIPTADGWLYLAVVEDLFSRMIVGWSMAETMESRLVVDAPDMAVRRRLPGAGLAAHSDRGSQYASDRYRRVLGRPGITCGMSEAGQCWDNAPVESFFAGLRREPVHGGRSPTREQAGDTIFECVEAFYNRARRHSSLGFLSPAEFERTHHPKRP
jgi:putative transposase